VKKLALLLLLALLYAGVATADYIGVTFGANAPAGSSGYNFTGDANCQGGWIISDTSTEAGSVADACGSDTMTWNGASWSAGQAAPTGTLSGQITALFNGGDQYQSVSTNVKWENDDFTAGCWIYHTAALNQVFFGKNDATNWELRANIGATFRGSVGTPDETSSTAGGLNAWGLEAMRYDGSAAGHADAADDKIEVFHNGLIACAGGCVTGVDPTGNPNSIRIGRNHSTSEQFAGSVMECMYFDRVLSDIEMAEWFLCGARGDVDDVEGRDTDYDGATCASAPGASAGCCP
jgi:hypothetical protein